MSRVRSAQYWRTWRLLADRYADELCGFFNRGVRGVQDVARMRLISRRRVRALERSHLAFEQLANG